MLKLFFFILIIVFVSLSAIDSLTIDRVYRSAAYLLKVLYPLHDYTINSHLKIFNNLSSLVDQRHLTNESFFLKNIIQLLD